MKTKFLLAILLLSASLSPAMAGGGTPGGKETGEAQGNQIVVVNNHYSLNGYEYASRITRFHRSFVSFDFYSPMYTEIYWYRYKPYTWGVSIYDDWYYYGAAATRNTWRSGFGGSYWWGYDPWRDYNPWMGYGWSSWYSPGVSFSVNFYLGRPYYHYPMAWNMWHQRNYRSFGGPVNIVSHNTYNYYYGSQRRDSRQSPPAGYNPSHPYSADRRPVYTSTGGRSSAARSAPPSSTDGRSSVSRTSLPSSTGGRTQAGASGGRSQAGATGPAGGRTQAGSANPTGGRTQAGSSRSGGNAAGGSDRSNAGGNSGNSNASDNGNNGLRMGQYRRGVAQPADPNDNGLPRTNNPNVNDRTNPGREQGNSDNASGQQGNSGNANGRQGNSADTSGRTGNSGNSNGRSGNSGKTTGRQGKDDTQTGVDRAPARSSQGQQTRGTTTTTTQGTVSTTTQGKPRTTTQGAGSTTTRGTTSTSSRGTVRRTTQGTVRTTTQKSTPAKRQDKAESSSQNRRTVKQNKKETTPKSTGFTEESGKSSGTKRRNT